MNYKILCLFLFLSSSLTAQKVKLKSKITTYTAIQLPNNPLDTAIKTYTSVINTNSKTLWSVGLKKAELNHNFLQLKGYQKLDKGGEILLQLDLGQFQIIKEELKETLKTIKGGDTPENKKYHYEFTYTMPIKLVAKNGDILFFSQAVEGDLFGKRTFDSPTFDTSSQAGKNKAKYKRQWIATATRDFVNTTVEQFYKKLNAQIGFMPTEQSLRFYYPNTKKLKQHEPFKQEVFSAMSILHKITADAPIEISIKQTVKELMQKWEKNTTNLSLADKSQARLKKAYLYNIMESALAIEDFEKAKWAANQLISDDLDKRPAKKRIQYINQIQERLAKTGLDSRHQLIQKQMTKTLHSETAPSTQVANTNEQFIQSNEAETRAQALGLHESAKAFDMEVKLRNGYSQKGILVVDYSTYDDLIFYNGGNYSFFVESVDKEIIRKKFSLAKIQSFDLEGRHFEVIINKGVLSSMVKNTIQVIEERKVTPKMIVYTALPMTQEDATTVDLAGNYLIQKKTDGKIVDISSLKFMNFKKSFSKFISDCPDLANKVKNGVLKRNLEDLVTIAQEYSTCKNE